MDAFELNKILGAVLGALVFVMGLSVLSEIIFAPHGLDTPGYLINIDDSSAAAEAPKEVPFAVLLQQGDAGAGKAGARVCGACHNFEEGGPNGIGPHLWGVVGRPIASAEGFNYSSALKEYGADKTWSYDELNGFIHAPQQDVPGTIMGFAGIKNDQDRANVVLFLKSISPDAPPLPEPPAAEEPAADEAAAEEATAAAGDAEPAATEEAEPAPSAN
ncbi:c-type cytochrome [Acuticoccus mangrovi]|uniref:Cytochrome c family protein n=1 Tax=Acuticoccus mangrovi TaxID=2796142 RepID=A0A934MM15_9HYPH|nr:cytochrome c family protein [Acuticoccus mangrovi]MBJ3776864.1 cytochrome c family protein [Acuticoccus mangrovi]